MWPGQGSEDLSLYREENCCRNCFQDTGGEDGASWVPGHLQHHAEALSPLPGGKTRHRGSGAMSGAATQVLSPGDSVLNRLLVSRDGRAWPHGSKDASVFTSLSPPCQDTHP